MFTMPDTLTSQSISRKNKIIVHEHVQRSEKKTVQSCSGWHLTVELDHLQGDGTAKMRI